MTTIPRLQHSQLEQAIYGKKTVADILAQQATTHSPETSPISQYVIADYVGSHTAKTGEYAKDDLRKTVAKVFFEDDGGYKTTLKTDDEQLTLTLFATFLVIEIRPGTPDVEFLVLIPQRDEPLNNARYAGLMKTQNTDALLDTLTTDSEAFALTCQQVQSLLSTLRSSHPPQTQNKKTGWFSQLFNKQG
jgi:hypothetical protein